MFNSQATVYLTPALVSIYNLITKSNSTSTILSDLEEMDCSKVYVIGGIVDLSINKVYILWNLRTMDTVGTGLLSIVGRLSLSRRSYLVWLEVSSLLLRVSTIRGSTVLLYM